MTSQLVSIKSPISETEDKLNIITDTDKTDEKSKSDDIKTISEKLN